MPATTIEGIKVKAYAALCYEGDFERAMQEKPLSEEDGLTATDVLYSLARNIMRLTV
jgi:hypothetical protein